MSTAKDNVSRSAIRRLSKYLLYIRQRRDEGLEWVLSHEMAEALGLTSATVRRDLSFLDFHGVPKRGYQTQQLDEALTRYLGADDEYHVVLVGAGNLGKALALHRGFSRHGFNIAAIYDHDPKVIGRKIGSLQVRDLAALEADLEAAEIVFGVLAVPAEAAQDVSDRLINAGVTGLLNLSLAHISAPEHVNVVDTQIVAGLQELACVSRKHS